MFQVPRAAIETDVNSRIHAGVAQCTIIFHAGNRLSSVIEIVAAGGKFLFCGYLRRGRAVKQHSESANLWDCDRYALIGKKQDAFRTAGKIFNLWRGLSAVNFNRKWNAHRWR